MSAQPTSKLSISLFGTMEIQQEGEVVTGFREKSKWLLAYLVLQRGKEIDYEVLGRLFWPAPPSKGLQGNKQAISSVRQCVSNLNRVLGSDRFTDHSRSAIGIKLTQVDVDVFAFDAAVANRDLASLRQAVQLYTGELLEGCTEDWIQPAREMRRQAYQGALELLIEQAQADGDFGAGENYLRLAIAADRYKEANRCSLMRVLMRRGEYNAALNVFDQYRRLLHDLKREVGPEMRRLREIIEDRVAPEKIRSSPASKSTSAAPMYRLPQPTRSMVGREKAVGEVAALFLFGRLVTLKGPPGIGKTHLALLVAEHLREDYPDGVVYCDLTAQKSTTDFWRVLASTLQIPDHLHQEAEANVCRFLESRQMLLLLDNCEHLVHSGVDVVRKILQECPYVRLLATSRRAWGTIPGERVYIVKPLSLPGMARLKRLSPDPLPELNAYSAIRLFMEQASEISSDFVLTPQDARAVAQICQLLDGVPLTILLAAGWIQTLTPQQILARLSQGLDFLRDSHPAGLVRQSRLMLMLESSYQLLTPSLQQTYRCLSVFQGGWTLKAAEDVCGTPRILDSLRQLQECSLVEAERDGAEMRYRLLGILQQFSARLLTNRAESTLLRHRHLDFFLQMTESTEPSLVGPEQETALAHLDREFANLTGALEWACESLEIEKGLRLAGALWRFWHIRGHYQDGLRCLTRLLKQEPVVTGSARSKALNGAGNLAFQFQNHTQARAWFQERLEFEQARGNIRAFAGALGSLANVESALGDYASARTRFELSLGHFRALEDRRGILMTLGNLAVVSHREGKPGDACIYHEECAKFFRDAGDWNNLAVALNNIADIRITLCEFSRAARLLKESLEIGRIQESQPTLLQSLTLTFFLLVKCDAMEQAALLVGATEAFMEQIQLPLPIEVQEKYSLIIEQVRTGLAEATFDSAHAQGCLLTLEETIEFALASLDADKLCGRESI